MVAMLAKLELKTPIASTEKFERVQPHCCKLVVWTEVEAEEEEEELTWTGGALEWKDM